MSAESQESYVQRRLRERMQAQVVPVVPPIPRDLLAYLEGQLRPQCFEGGDQAQLQAHLKYAGAVELVRQLRAIYEQQQTEGADGVPDVRTDPNKEKTRLTPKEVN